MILEFNMGIEKDEAFLEIVAENHNNLLIIYIITGC
jgi:hypothetical protein